MKLLTTSMDGDYISEIADYLQLHEIAVHIGNQKTSSLPGSGSYQRSLYVLSEEQYEDAISLLKEGGYWVEPVIIDSAPKESLMNNKWFMFIAAMILALLFAAVIL